MNITNLNKVSNVLKNEIYELFNMNYGFESKQGELGQAPIVNIKKKDGDYFFEPECGTCCCFAGIAYVLSQFESLNVDSATIEGDVDGKWDVIRNVASEWLELTDEQADELFKTYYFDDGRKIELPEDGIERIENFIKKYSK